MQTDDIAGAGAGSKNKGAFTFMDRRQVRPVNDITDISGC